MKTTTMSGPAALQPETELLEALQRLGAKRVEATLVAALAQGEPLGTNDLVEHTHLRQPEVSVGMQELRERGWVAAEPVPRQGKGRPMHRYRLLAKMGTVRAYYENLGKRAIAEFNAAMQVVQRYLG
jgi:predicted transcriptional regulator